jgi:hypothetical protein
MNGNWQLVSEIGKVCNTNCGKLRNKSFEPSIPMLMETRRCRSQDTAQHKERIITHTELHPKIYGVIKLFNTQ